MGLRLMFFCLRRLLLLLLGLLRVVFEVIGLSFCQLDLFIAYHVAGISVCWAEVENYRKHRKDRKHKSENINDLITFDVSRDPYDADRYDYLEGEV